jgi:hypothetical protein
VRSIQTYGGDGLTGFRNRCSSESRGGLRSPHAVSNELTKRVADGWERVTAYQEQADGHRHMLIFKRATNLSAPEANRGCEDGN